MPRAPSPIRRRPVAHLLSGLVLACLLPGILGSAGFLLNEYRGERIRQNEDMLRLAREAGEEIDAHLLRAQTAAQSLAHAQQRSEDTPDLFTVQGARLLAASLDTPVVVYRADGDRIVGISSRDDRPIPAPREMQAIRTVFETGKALISNVAIDTPTGEPAVTVHLPVSAAGSAAYSLAVLVPATQLSAILSQRRLPEGWLASLLDRNGIIAGRNRGAERYVGQAAMDKLRRATAAQETGQLDTVTKDGVDNFAVFARSPRTGYTAIVGVPRAQVLGPLVTRLLYLAAAVGCLFVLGLLLARAMSRRIAGSIQALIEPASALGRGMRPVVPAVHLSEAAEVGAAIERAAGLLCQRDAALAAQQEELEQFKFFTEHANEMLLLLDEDGNIRYANRKVSERLGYGKADLLAMTLFQIDLPTNPERLRRVFDQCRQAQPPAFERVYSCRDGTEIPVEITATVLEVKGEWLMQVVPRDIAERRQAEQAVRWAASHDGLTGLANRAMALSTLDGALADLHPGAPGGALLFVDLDRFKPVNDQYGHEVGDRVLQQVAQRLQACVDPDALLARVGGDEFVVVIPCLDHEQARERPAAIARAILDAMASPIEVGNIEALLTASIGISRFPEHGDTANLLIHAADMAMLQVKHNGRAGFEWYSPHMDAQAQFTLSVERRLQYAVDHGGLVLHYQPIVDLASGRVDGVEALVRLEDGIEPAVGPGTFVPIAESSGLILPIGAWVAREACRQQGAWEAAGLPLTVSINVSALQFRRAAFCDRVRTVIAAAGIDPQRVVIELTETAIMENLAEAIDILNEVKKLGVRVALDDFGTGYSSLSSLSTLPLDKLKIDQSFVRRIETDHASRAVIDAVIALGHSLNLELVAEGIETRAALDYLRERGCQLGQGYYLSRPLARYALEDWYGRRVA
jgi:diguanylate cyclase (GGDEF)-like protein/PAS domain S-box-containing protein